MPAYTGICNAWASLSPFSVRIGLDEVISQEEVVLPISTAALNVKGGCIFADSACRIWLENSASIGQRDTSSSRDASEPLIHSGAVPWQWSSCRFCLKDPWFNAIACLESNEEQ